MAIDDEYVHLVRPFRQEIRDAPRLHQVTLLVTMVMNVWLFVFTLTFVPYGVLRWGWGYNLG